MEQLANVMASKGVQLPPLPRKHFFRSHSMTDEVVQERAEAMKAIFACLVPKYCGDPVLQQFLHLEYGQQRLAERAKEKEAPPQPRESRKAQLPVDAQDKADLHADAEHSALTRQHGLLDDKTCVVLGGTGNIGAGVALAYAQEGANVIITGRSQARAVARCVRISMIARQTLVMCVCCFADGPLTF